MICLIVFTFFCVFGHVWIRNFKVVCLCVFLNYFKRIATFRSSPVRNFPGLFNDDWSDWSVISGI
jgi:hypothetical protein